MILGASFDTPADNRAFHGKFGFPFDLLCDQTRDIGIAYGVAADETARYPARVSYLIDTRGVIERVYARVDPAIHCDQVLDDLRGLS